MSKNDGGPAFPLYVENTGNNDVDVCGHMLPPSESIQFTGMSLRDYFAAKAMQTVLRDAVMPTKADQLTGSALVASFSYLMADAMLAERSK